jgi:hypothetical protein
MALRAVFHRDPTIRVFVFAAPSPFSASSQSQSLSGNQTAKRINATRLQNEQSGRSKISVDSAAL